MLIAERHKKIIQLVNERKSIRVTELSKIFSKTEETIRRDLEKLEAEKRLIRSHGGAISVEESNHTEVPYFEREITNIKEKKQIALEAIKHVIEGDTISLDASSTAWYMAKSLPDIRLTVVTNSVRVAMELSTKRQITVILVGGILSTESLSVVGPLTESSLDTYYVHKAFISCKGFHFDRGMSESTEEQARIKQQMITNTDYVYVMIDHSKFDVQSFTQFGNIDQIDYIITNQKTDRVLLDQLTDRSLQVIQTDA